MTSVANFKCE